MCGFYSTLAGLGWAGQQGYQRHTPWFLGLMERGRTAYWTAFTMRSMRDRMDIHAWAFCLVLVSFFLFVFFVLLVVAFGQKGLKGRRTEKKRELQKSYCFTYIHILIFGGNGNPTVLSCIYLDKKFWFPFVGNCFIPFRFFLFGGFPIIVFLRVFLASDAPIHFIQNRLDNKKCTCTSHSPPQQPLRDVTSKGMQMMR